MNAVRRSGDRNLYTSGKRWCIGRAYDADARSRILG